MGQASIGEGSCPLSDQEAGIAMKQKEAGKDGVRWIPIILGPLLTLLTWYLAPEDYSKTVLGTLMVTVWTVTWWVTEAIPIPASSLLPAVLLPLFGVCDAGTAAKYYSHHLILLLLGGFMLARAVECSGLHRRIAISTLIRLGTSPRRLALGFLITSAVLSMWISNTATTLMLLPIAISVARRTEEGQDLKGRFTLCLLLCTAYGANVGGIGTLIGTPPNLIFVKNAQDLIPPIEVGFLQWLVLGLPVVVLFLPIMYLLLTRFLIPLPAGENQEGRDALREELKNLGPMRSEESRVFLVFLVTALLWVTRGSGDMPGWVHLLGPLLDLEPAEYGKYLNDSIVSVACAIALFIIPSGKAQPPLLDWDRAKDVPWGMLLLFGGGFAIGGAFQSSGLSTEVGTWMASWNTLPFPMLVMAISSVTTFLTEVTSNTASMHLLMPVLSSAAIQGGISPIQMMLPAVLSVSCAFMLPVATAPNAIVFATGKIPIRFMIRCGFALNVIGVLIVLVVSLTLGALGWLPGPSESG